MSVEVPLGMPHFGGDGHLVVDTKRGLAKRGGGPVQSADPIVSYLFLNFSTAQHDGMVLWTSQVHNWVTCGSPVY